MGWPATTAAGSRSRRHVGSRGRSPRNRRGAAIRSRWGTWRPARQWRLPRGGLHRGAVEPPPLLPPPRATARAAPRHGRSSAGRALSPRCLWRPTTPAHGRDRRGQGRPVREVPGAEGLPPRGAPLSRCARSGRPSYRPAVPAAHARHGRGQPMAGRTARLPPAGRVAIPPPWAVAAADLAWAA